MIDKVGSNPLTIALQGLQRSRERFSESVTRVASGDISAEALVDTKINELDVKAQLATIRRVSDLEESVLDIIA